MCDKLKSIYDIDTCTEKEHGNVINLTLMKIPNQIYQHGSKTERQPFLLRSNV